MWNNSSYFRHSVGRRGHYANFKYPIWSNINLLPWKCLTIPMYGSFFYLKITTNNFFINWLTCFLSNSYDDALFVFYWFLDLIRPERSEALRTKEITSHYESYPSLQYIIIHNSKILSCFFLQTPSVFLIESIIDLN